VLKLAGRPAGVAERYEKLSRAFAACHGLQDVLGGCQADLGAHGER